MELFHYVGRTHAGPEYLSDRDYDPLVCIMLRDLAKVKEKYSEDEGRITQEEKNWILCYIFKYSRNKAAKILKSMIMHGEMTENDDRTFSMTPFDFKKQYVKVDKETLQFFYDTFGKESMAFKAYCFLGTQWAAHVNLRAYQGGFHFTLGGGSNASTLRKLGYKSSSKEIKDKLKSALNVLASKGLISFSGPHDLTFGDRRINSVYTLLDWKSTPRKDIVPSNVQEAAKRNHASPHRHHAHRIEKFSDYYMPDDDPSYEVDRDLSSLGENAVVIAFYGMSDESIMHLVRDYPNLVRTPPARIMYSTIEPEDDDD